ncbi:hypothetical protein CEXT_89931 [Caerostris extrusa]|uniref:Uncharacterized protein n=1 Tax=Caerostris extrusa TaxID=172846 RepID=A0AAV4WSF7_CAEEX|nr:hypothetical protein CEXT_89931 [Caerostris extrusa]
MRALRQRNSHLSFSCLNHPRIWTPENYGEGATLSALLSGSLSGITTPHHITVPGAEAAFIGFTCSNKKELSNRVIRPIGEPFSGKGRSGKSPSAASGGSQSGESLAGQLDVPPLTKHVEPRAKPIYLRCLRGKK